MSALSDQIFAIDDIESELVTVPQWGGITVMVKAMTAAARSQMISNAVENGGSFNVNDLLPDMVIACTFDPATGASIFSPGDRDRILAKSAAAVSLISDTAMRLSGMLESSEGVTAVDAAGKDFSSTPTEDSSLS